MRSVVLASVLLCLSSQVMAKDPQVDCNNPQGTYEDNYCAEQAYKKADAQLNSIYKKVMNHDNFTEQKSLLTQAQKTWLKYRDEHCEVVVYNNRGGTGFAGFLSNCLTEVTAQRTEALKALLESLEQ